MKFFISLIISIHAIYCLAINVKQFTIPNNPLTISLPKIPCGSGSSSGLTYVTQAGDTCQSLGLISTITQISLNLTSICNNLPTGLPICIPSSVPFPSGSGSSGSGSSVSCSSGTVAYTILKGDTCYQLGLTWQQINNLNLNCIF